MEFLDHVMRLIRFGLMLWLGCTISGGVIGGAVAALQIFAGKWHPAWVPRLSSWFVFPLVAGLASGVVLALAIIPSQSAGSFFWLLSCLATSSIAAAFAAGALASLTRNYDLKIIKIARRDLRRKPGASDGRFAQWENHLRALFHASAPAEVEESPRRRSRSRSSVPQQKTELPPERFPSDPTAAKTTHYAGHPREAQMRQGKSEKPDR